MSIDAFKNFAVGTLSAGITSGATSVTLTTGHGARFPLTTFLAVIFDNSYSSADQDVNAEVVRVTAGFGTDTFTITRAQDNTVAAAHNTGGKTYAIVSGWFAEQANKALDKTGDTMTGPLILSGLRLPVSSVKSANYTLLATDCIVPYDGTATFTLTLPPASNGKQFYWFTQQVNTGGTCTLAGVGGDVVQSAVATNSTSITISGRVPYVSDGVSKWLKLA